MKKKVLYGAALALFASVSMGTLQSCKDDLSDLTHQNAYAHEGFQGQIKDLTDDLNGLKSDLDACKTNCTNKIGDLEQQISDLADRIKDAEDNAEDTDALVQDMNDKLQELAAVVEGLQNAGSAGLTLDQVQDLLNAYAKKTDLDGYATKDELNNVKTVLENKIATELLTLQTQINTLETTLNTKISDLTTEFNNKVDGIISTQNDLTTRIVKLEADYQTQLEAINAANKEIEQLWLQMNSQNELISQIYNSLKDDLAELGNQYAELANEHDLLVQDIFGEGGLRDQMSQMYTALQEAFQAGDEELWLAIQERDEQLTQAMNLLRAEFSEVDEELWNTIGAVREEMSMMLFSLQNSIQELGDELRNEDEQLWLAINGPGGLQEQISQVLNLHAADIQALEEKLEDLNTKYNNLLGRVDTLITGILLQSTDSPVFGNFSLPIGVKSNVLFNWYGYNSQQIKTFPSNSNAYAYNDELAGVDFAALGAKTEAIQQDFMGDVNLGRVYLTVNPVGHNFDNTKFTLETSAGKALPFGLKISKSNDELYFGYSRSEVNGFYAADVVIDGDQNALHAGIDATKLTIDDDLKTAVKDVLKDRTKRNAVNLLKAIYGQVSNKLPAYAVRYDWKDADGNPYAVLSNYDLAVASAKPLSYNNLKFSIDHKLRHFGHLDNFIYKLKDNENLKFDFTKYNLTFEDGKYEIKIKPLKIDDTTIKVNGGQLTVNIPEISVFIDGDSVGHTQSRDVPVDENNLNNLYKSIEDGIKNSINSATSQISGWTDDLTEQVNGKISSLLSDVQSKLNQMLQEIGDDLTGRLDNIINDAANKAQPWFDRLNKLVDLYNKVADRINNVLEDPNHYLQVAMFYQGGRAGINVVSNVKEDPTVFAAGKGYVGLYASSYTAELVAPAFKKFVAVSNVYKKTADGKVVVADNAKAEMDRINGSKNKDNNLNKVMSGNTIRYWLTEELTKGLIYEIVYQGLDYHGVTSTQKFYITVK